MKLYGLIGYPLLISSSKPYFEEKFRQSGISDSRFELFPIEKADSFPEIIEREKDLLGLAVTIPHKQAVMPYLHSISEEAKAIGAVNCIRVRNGETIGYNTDAGGFENSLKPLLKPHHTKALVLGNGGAAKAIIYVLRSMGIDVLVVSRNPRQDMIPWQNLTESVITEHTLVVNCTPVGMMPHENEVVPFPFEFLTTQHLLYDLIYRPEETVFMKKGQEMGAATKNGLEMLHLQAEKNWEIWNQ